MRAYVNLLTQEVGTTKPADLHITLDITVEDAEDGRDEWDRMVALMVLVPRGTFLQIGLAPQEPAPTMN